MTTKPARTMAFALCALVLCFVGTACIAGDPTQTSDPARGDAPAVQDQGRRDQAEALGPRRRGQAPAGRELPQVKVPPQFDGEVLGADSSWPQCPTGMGIPEKPTQGMPMPLKQAKFVILGLTNGPGFTPNPCLADQVSWVRSRSLMIAAYAVHSYPDQETLSRLQSRGPFRGAGALTALKNVGYQQALFNVRTMRAAGLPTPVVWMDVEPVPVFEWSTDTVANGAVIKGALRGYRESGYLVGAYSTPALWRTVVGDLRLGLPEWRAAGHTSRAEAQRRCAADWSFQGGDAVFAQWVEQDRDQNITCPGVERELYRWFHQF